MKPILFLISFTFLSIISKAQIPDYFGNNPEWRLSSQYPTFEGCILESEIVYYLNGDSIVDGVIYKKLFERGVEKKMQYGPLDSPCSGSSTFDNFRVLIRQEGKKIYVKDHYGNEYLYYDFNLNVGDTIQGTYLSQFFSEPAIVLEVDSVLMDEFEDVYWKIFHFSSYSEDNFFIEGIGHKYGFLEPPGLIYDAASWMHCYAQNEYVLYTFEDGGSCDFTVSVNEVNAIPFEFTISPNPASQRVNISVGENVLAKWVRIYSITGKQMIEETVSQNPCQIDLSGLQKGLYLLEIESVDGFQQIKRLVIE